MLSGTFDLFSLAEVLGLIQRAGTSGALVVRGCEVDATLYLVAGEFSGGEAADLSGPVADLDALETRMLEVCVAVLRCRAAEFEFLADHTPPWPAALSLPITAILERANAIAREWPSIMSAVESFESMLERTGSITTESLTLSALGFRVLELVDGRTTIRQLAQRAEASLIVVAPEIRALIVAGAVRVLVDSERALATAQAAAVSEQARTPRGVVDVTEAASLGASHLPGPSAPAAAPGWATTSVAPAAVAADRSPVIENVVPAADPADYARERADLASRAGLSDPGPVPETVARPEADAPAVERAQIVVDRSDLLRMFSGLKEE
ncbi:MAG: DUF4388 domain-containing protein [Acidimicrobiia bacterium]